MKKNLEKITESEKEFLGNASPSNQSTFVKINERSPPQRTEFKNNFTSNGRNILGASRLDSSPSRPAENSDEQKKLQELGTLKDQIKEMIFKYNHLTEIVKSGKKNEFF